ncbi:MAG: translation initiation factor IF-2 [Acidobacteria bacterium]|nr:translation initiation factor IF-2 [Acidobacteriota bacterium]
MGSIANKVRVYDLAKELKLENRKVIEDARRLGVDVSVPSNTLPDAVADKIREMYFPKKEQAATPRTARLIKHAVPPPGTAQADVMPTAPLPGAPVTTPAVRTPQPVAPVSALAEAAPPAQEVRKLSTQPLGTRPVKPAPAAELPPVAMPAPADVAEIRAETLVPLPAIAPPAAPALTAEPEAEQAIQEESITPAPALAPLAEPVESPAAPITEAPAAAPPAPAPSRPAGPAVTKLDVPPITKQMPATTGALPASARAPHGHGQPHGQPANRTTVIKLAPAKPFQPQPQQPQPRIGRDGRTGQLRQPGQTGQLGQAGAPGQTGPLGREGRGAPRTGEAGAAGDRKRAPGVHLLESGKPQLHTYVPPPDARHKGRHTTHRKGDKDATPDRQNQLRKGFQAPQPQVRQAPVELKPLRLVEGTTVREFAEKAEAKPRDVVAELMKRGVMATINQVLNPDLAKDLGRLYGWDVTFGEFEEMMVESEFEITPEAMDDTEMRAPVVTVMGHVDHGKTSLLDAIRSARVAEGEAGGITQHIGAYSVQVANPDNPVELRRVVFLDTPGHEAFTMMRARGAKVTDIVVLVVAADDGVMPQTIEAIEHAKAANVPIIVAINKIDKGDANPERVKKELADRGLLWDSWGGDTTMVEVSAKMRQNVNGVLEMILLQADLMDLKANPKRMATGTVLEAKLDRGRGAVATVLVQNGSLKVGEPFIVGNYFGKVRALMNDRGERVTEVGPAMPVEVLGLEGVPGAGDQFQVVDDISKAQQISQFRQAKARTTALARSAARGLDQLAMQMETGEVKELLVILKADVQGSVEVLKDTLLKLSTDKVKVRIIRAGVGAITYDDVLLASASNATSVGAATVIIGFNVRPEARAEEIAKQEEVDIRLHSIIYKVEEEIRNAMIGMLDATTKEVVLGKASVRDIIRVPKIGNIAGCLVLNGLIKRTAQARLIRDNVVIFEAPIGSLRRFKDDVSEVQQNFECGITIERFNDYKVGDVIEAYVTEKVAATKL